MKTVAFHTLGCKVNQYETQAMRELFINSGYHEVDFSTASEVYIINTCTVTSLSDRKSRQMIRRARRLSPNAVIAVTGCYAQTSPDEVQRIGGVNIVIGTDRRAQIVDLVQRATASDSIVGVGDIMHNHHFEELTVSSYTERARAYIKVQEGCQQFCSYCIIPYARGPVRSRDPQEVLREAARLSEAGFCELILTGIHIASYGADIPQSGTSLAHLIGEIQKLDGVKRIRLSSIEPMTLDESFITSISGASKLCPHFHISLQSGCDSTLRRMNRKYTADGYAAIVDGLRKVWPDAAITTDVMVGFPGETEEEFEESLAFVRRMGFADMHVFQYSPRKGTPAATMEKQIPPQIKQARSEAMIETARESRMGFMERMIGRTCSVLFEQPVEGLDGYYTGKTPNYIDVVCKGENLVGLMRNVVIDGIMGETLTGRIVSDEK